MKAIKEHFHIMLYKKVLTLKSVDQTLVCGHLDESLLSNTFILCCTLCCKVQREFQRLSPICPSALHSANTLYILVTLVCLSWMIITMKTAITGRFLLHAKCSIKFLSVLKQACISLSCNLISMKKLPFNHLFAPFYSPVLKPNSNLRLAKLKFLSQL